MGVAERKQREKEKRRNEILDAAEELFFSQGLQQTTMDDLATRTELSKGTLYLYFRSKDEVYLGINVRAKKLMCEQMERAAGLPGKGREKVLALGRAYLGFSLEYPDYAQVMQSCMISEGELLDANVYAREAHEHGERALMLLFKALQTGQIDGSIKTSLDTRKTGLLLWAQLTGILQIMAAKGPYLSSQLQVTEAELTNYVFTLTEVLLTP